MSSKSRSELQLPVRRAALSRAASLCASLFCVSLGVVLASCHAAPVPEVAPKLPDPGSPDPTEASSMPPEPILAPALEAAPSPTPAETPAPVEEPSPPAASPPTVETPAAPAAPAPPAKAPTSPPKAAPTAAASSTPAAKPAAYAGDQPCRAATFEVKAVEKACHQGGRSAAKDLMKHAVANAKAKGESLNCTSCHIDQKTYATKPNAAKELARWL